MTPATAGALVGALGGVGLLLVVARVVAIRRTSLDLRVLPWVQDLPRLDHAAGPVRRLVAPSPDLPTASPLAAASGLLAPALRRAADAVDGVLGGGVSVQRRLQRAGLETTVQEFRVEQVIWGLVAFAMIAAWRVVAALGGDTRVVPALLLCGCAFVGGVIARDQRLSSQATTRDRAILAEFPVLAELLALAVASGEGPVAALDRVVARSTGELSQDLGRVLAEIRTGEPVVVAFDRLSRTTGVPMVAQFSQGLSIALERGTPLADVLHAQAGDVREAGRRALIESAARREVFMLVPVVFLVLPIVILFALYPGLVGLRITTP
ncbi:type II secretion system F family protein [Nocardioides jishulii]|uniref:Type II secretion system F family protein n=1 Tax=Nocardioides jishulii TaxID=2575440 RepID=A0A4U2YLB0_9ACTN|nr:type II secretion system F family protein [Nocardioides jishulii]QCX26798.1 type II secretion system F family protein [Nocardioides jishulii]TKI61282.1 type II secretion system F family protein [Nocardioides jishulii]